MTLVKKISVGFATGMLAFGLVGGGSSAAYAEIENPVSPQIEENSISAGDAKEILSGSNFKESGKTESGKIIYSGTISGVNIEYEIPEDDSEIISLENSAAEGSVELRKINVGWDNGPRLYMTGTDFWNLGASGLKELCTNIPFLGGMCESLVQRVWEDTLTGPGKPLNDDTCYDLSQTLNVGWEEMPPERCE